ncbi:hypothetical protein ACWF94_06825 [Streptomyces sp. NPDC055078]
MLVLTRMTRIALTAAASVGLVMGLSPEALAANASGNFNYTRADTGSVNKMTDMTTGICHIMDGGSRTTTFLDNLTNKPASVFSNTNCTGSSFTIQPAFGQRLAFSAHSVRFAN